MLWHDVADMLQWNCEKVILLAFESVVDGLALVGRVGDIHIYYGHFQ